MKVQYILLEAEEVLFCEMRLLELLSCVSCECGLWREGVQAVVTNCFDGKGLDVRSEI